MNEYGTRWSTHNTYVDLDTGQIITRKQFEKNYIKYETIKKIVVNDTKTEGHIYRTIKCRKNPQLNISFGNRKNT